MRLSGALSHLRCILSGGEHPTGCRRHLEQIDGMARVDGRSRCGQESVVHHRRSRSIGTLRRAYASSCRSVAGRTSQSVALVECRRRTDLVAVGTLEFPSVLRSVHTCATAREDAALIQSRRVAAGGIEVGSSQSMLSLRDWMRFAGATETRRQITRTARAGSRPSAAVVRPALATVPKR